MKSRALPTFVGVVLLLCTALVPARADLLVATNGERFSGKIVEETAEAVIFDSDLAGRLNIPRAKILEIQRTPPPSSSANEPSTFSSKPSVASGTNDPSTLSWLPPGVGTGRSDWIQLKSGEWLKGRLRYIQQHQVDFDSDELKDVSFDLEDVRQVYPAKPLFTKFDGRDQIYGTVIVSNDQVRVFGPEQITLPRDQLTGITPGGKREIDFWSGSLDISLSLESGNTRQANVSLNAELARRTPSTVAQLTYLGNYGRVEGIRSANNHRVDGLYDIRLDRHWFIRPVFLDYYKDELANIDHQGTVALGVGYYIFDRDGLEWTVSGGPGYQHTRYLTVEAGQSDTSSTPAGVLQTSFKVDITRRLKFSEALNLFVTRKEAGLYSHHSVSTLEFEIKRHLDLNVAFVWDYLQNPQTESDGFIPEHSDLRLNVGVGVKF